MHPRFLVLMLAVLAASGQNGRCGEAGWRFAPTERIMPAEPAAYGDGQLLNASVEFLAPATSPDSEVRVRVRLHWEGFTINAINPFLDPTLEPVAQLAVFDDNGLYEGNLIGWRPSSQVAPLASIRSNPVSTRWDRGSGVTGRTVVTKMIVQPESGARRVLAEGRHRAQLIVYDRIFADRKQFTETPIAVCRSQTVAFEVKNTSQRPELKRGGGVEFRFAGDPLRFEIENGSDAVEELYDPWLVHYETLGDVGAYRFEWRLDDGSTVVSSPLPRWLPQRGMWIRMPPGGFAGRDLYFKPSDRMLKSDRVTLVGEVLEGAWAKNAFPDREAPWDFFHCTETVHKSKPALFADGKWTVGAEPATGIAK